MMKIIRDHKLKLIFIFFNTIALFSKQLYFVHELGLSPHKKNILITSFAFSIILASILFLKKSKLNTIGVLLIYLVVSILLYSDVVYERYYDAILSLDLLGQAGQVGEVLDSVISLMYVSDIWYWIDIPIAILLVLYIFRGSRTEKLTKSKVIIASGTTLASLLSIFVITITSLENNYSDQYKIALTGVIPTHVYELFKIGESKGLNEFEITKKIKREMESKYNEVIHSDMFGKYKGKNVIVIQAESLNAFPINLSVNNQEITPNINKLVENSNYYPNTFLQIGRGNTSDAEFVANNSIYPIAKQGIYKTYPGNIYTSLANVLSEEGYSTSAVHGNTADFWNREEAYEKLGFQEFYHKDHEKISDDELIGLGISDASMFKQMLKIYEETDKPFYSFIVTLTVHRPFELPKEYKGLDFGEEENTATANYLQSVYYFDRALGEFIEGLKKSGLWEDTILVLYGDHYGLLPNNKGELESLFNISFEQKERFKVPLIIHHPEQEHSQVNDIVASQMDIYPTLTTILGIDKPLIQFGESLYIKESGFAGFAYETTKYSYYTDGYDYIASHDGIFESGQCIDNNTGKEVDNKYCSQDYMKLKSDIEASDIILQKDKIDDLTKELNILEDSHQK